MNRRMLLVGAAAAVVAAGAWWILSLGRLDESTRTAVNHFFATYVGEDGRVQREQGDTVSEGQAYALLMAVATNRPDRFAAVWNWSRENLLRGDGGMAWRWVDGAVDRELAPDADVDAAVALFLAADRFGEPDYARAGRRMAEAVLGAAAVRVDGVTYLTAGEWAREGLVINPSYLDPASLEFLARTTGDQRWTEVAESSRQLLSRLTEGALPPDWLSLADGKVSPIASPEQASGPGRFSFEALRVPLRLATSCTESLSAGMAAVWPEVANHPGAAVRRLDGRPMEAWEHPAALVSAAALARTFAPHRVNPLLDEAAALEAAEPTYYGAALTALGRLLLTTDTLERCA
jgi:endoglucanase